MVNFRAVGCLLSLVASVLIVLGGVVLAGEAVKW